MERVVGQQGWREWTPCVRKGVKRKGKEEMGVGDGRQAGGNAGAGERAKQRVPASSSERGGCVCAPI